ncbi:TetR family transcriptional regulator [Gulosibacter sp. 10]|uniref:TetR family transcriptional regulator n=1 Tax=Gulosibacter sp. 10 TaxID=1255570 RepID=UPI00097F1BF0|nr:TetR family transcriptional regulator [Gulosibacter sp. 10]SJM65201.1 Transcriptional regulator, TetR family [Gulosibacter sp. 10]
MTNIGGRPRRIDRRDILRVGLGIGLRDLSLNAVASALGVSAAALYRHVDGRWGLEQLVGEHLLAELRLPDDPERDAAGHLVDFGLALRESVLGHPGLAAYLQTLFPRGDGGRALLVAEIEALGRRGYAPATALVLASAVASHTIGYAAGEEIQRDRGAELEQHRDRVLSGIMADERLQLAHTDLPQVDSAGYFRLVLMAVVDGLVAAAPKDRSVHEVVAALEARHCREAVR